MLTILAIKRSELYALILFLVMLTETAFGNTPLQRYNLVVNRIILFIEIIFFAVFLVMERYSQKRVALITSLSLVFVSSYFILGSAILFKMFMVAMVVSKIDTTRAFKIMFKYKVFILLIIISMSIIGIIPNTLVQVAKGVGTTFGYGLGYSHPNRLASSICCAILCYFAWKKNSLRIGNIIIVGLVTIVFFYITKCRTLLYYFIIFLYTSKDKLYK